MSDNTANNKLKVAIIGTGQQGRSLAEALSLAGNYQISGFDSSKDTLSRFGDITLGNDDIHTAQSAQDAVENADIIILATPIDKFGAVLQGLDGSIKQGAVITDVGSGKQKSIESIKQNLPDGAVYIPSHPIAGKAGVGPETGFSSLYQNETIVVVPDSNHSNEQAVIEAMWQDAGGRVEHMSAFAHDMLYGTISHFEHVIAFAEVLAGEDINHADRPDENYMKAGNTLQDTTRIAEASIPMWQAIFRDNNGSIMKAAQGFESQINILKSALEQDSPKDLQRILVGAHEFRVNIEEARPRESIYGEVADWALDEGESSQHDPKTLTDNFNQNAVSSLAQMTMVPTLVSAALTLNAQSTEKELGSIQIADKANPSFKDGSAAMLSDPAYVADLLFYNRDALKERLKKFEDSYSDVMDAVRSKDDAEIERIIIKASAIRAQMPRHKSPEDMRDEYAIGGR